MHVGKKHKPWKDDSMIPAVPSYSPGQVPVFKTPSYLWSKPFGSNRPPQFRNSRNSLGNYLGQTAAPKRILEYVYQGAIIKNPELQLGGVFSRSPKRFKIKRRKIKKPTTTLRQTAGKSNFFKGFFGRLFGRRTAAKNMLKAKAPIGTRNAEQWSDSYRFNQLDPAAMAKKLKRSRVRFRTRGFAKRNKVLTYQVAHTLPINELPEGQKVSEPGYVKDIEVIAFADVPIGSMNRGEYYGGKRTESGFLKNDFTYR